MTEWELCMCFVFMSNETWKFTHAVEKVWNVLESFKFLWWPVDDWAWFSRLCGSWCCFLFSPNMLCCHVKTVIWLEKVCISDFFKNIIRSKSESTILPYHIMKSVGSSTEDTTEKLVYPPWQCSFLHDTLCLGVSNPQPWCLNSKRFPVWICRKNTIKKHSKQFSSKFVWNVVQKLKHCWKYCIVVRGDCPDNV
jgi:hypothetical protein